jgi:hypothetical protein
MSAIHDIGVMLFYFVKARPAFFVALLLAIIFLGSL